MAVDSRDSRGGRAVLAEDMAKARSPCQMQGEWKVSPGQELAGMQIPRSCKEEKESRRMVGRSCLRPHCTAGMLIPHHHPKSGLRCASPFWVRDTLPCSARHETAAWYMVSTAAETMLQGKGRFQEERRAGNLWARFELNQSLCLARQKAQFHRNSCIWRTDPIQQHLGMGKKAFFVPGEKEPTHRAQNLQVGL